MLTSRARNKVKKKTWSISRYQAWTYDLRNSSVSRLRLNDNNDEDDVTCDGRLFHAWAAATGNARPPSVFRWKRGTRQDWPSKPTEGSVAKLSPTHVWIHRRGSSAPAHGGICRPAPPVDNILYNILLLSCSIPFHFSVMIYGRATFILCTP